MFAATNSCWPSRKMIAGHPEVDKCPKSGLERFTGSEIGKNSSFFVLEENVLLFFVLEESVLLFFVLEESVLLFFVFFVLEESVLKGF